MPASHTQSRRRCCDRRHMGCVQPSTETRRPDALPPLSSLVASPQVEHRYRPELNSRALRCVAGLDCTRPVVLVTANVQPSPWRKLLCPNRRGQNRRIAIHISSPDSLKGRAGSPAPARARNVKSDRIFPAARFVAGFEGHFQLCYRAALYPRFCRLPGSSDYLITRCRGAGRSWAVPSGSA
jgi:hypothetical protein